MVYKYNSYATKKIPYKRILNRIRMVKLSKQPLPIACRGKETNTSLTRTNTTSIT